LAEIARSVPGERRHVRLVVVLAVQMLAHVLVDDGAGAEVEAALLAIVPEAAAEIRRLVADDAPVVEAALVGRREHARHPSRCEEVLHRLARLLQEAVVLPDAEPLHVRTALLLQDPILRSRER